VSSPAFQAAREAHLRAIGREDLISPEPKPAPTDGGLHDPAWVERELKRLDAEGASEASLAK
jgi:hypothetical protein